MTQLTAQGSGSSLDAATVRIHPVPHEVFWGSAGISLWVSRFSSFRTVENISKIRNVDVVSGLRSTRRTVKRRVPKPIGQGPVHVHEQIWRSAPTKRNFPALRPGSAPPTLFTPLNQRTQSNCPYETIPTDPLSESAQERVCYLMFHFSHVCYKSRSKR